MNNPTIALEPTNRFSRRRAFAQYVSRIIDIPVPPQAMNDYVGGGTPETFRHVGAVIVEDLCWYGVIPQKDPWTLVDIGCGCGRAAIFIAPLMESTDRYFGYDTWGEGIEWAVSNYSLRYPSLQFEHLSTAHIEQGRRKGYMADIAFRLSAHPDETVDGVLATSLFTHLTLAGATAYLSEINRILKPGRKAFITCFFARHNDSWLEQYRGSAITKNADGYFVFDDTYADSYFFEDALLPAIELSGFRVEVKEYGIWRGDRKEASPYLGQDLMILVKR